MKRAFITKSNKPEKRKNQLTIYTEEDEMKDLKEEKDEKKKEKKATEAEESMETDDTAEKAEVCVYTAHSYWISPKTDSMLTNYD